MINSLFMLGAAFNKNRKVSVAFMIGWIAYVIINQLYLGLFPIINAVVFLVVTVGINLIKNKKINTVLSIISILIWSIIIDVICYYMYPLFPTNQNILGYIWQGILFNYKYIFTNIVAVAVIYSFDLILYKLEIKIKEMYNVSKSIA